jgi:hypothetical protein
MALAIERIASLIATKNYSIFFVAVKNSEIPLLPSNNFFVCFPCIKTYWVVYSADSWGPPFIYPPLGSSGDDNLFPVQRRRRGWRVAPCAACGRAAARPIKPPWTKLESMQMPRSSPCSPTEEHDGIHDLVLLTVRDGRRKWWQQGKFL